MSTRTGSSAKRSPSTPWALWLGGAVAIAAAIGIGFYFARTGKPPVSELPGQTALARTQSAAPTTSIQHPIQDAAIGAGLDEDALPALDASDAAALAALGALAGDGLGSLMNPEHVIQRIVATIDSLPRQKLASDTLPVRAATGAFAVRRDGMQNEIDPQNFARYAPYVRVAQTADAKKLVAAYVHFYPLFQQSYRELGYPDGYFNDRLVAVIDHLLATPDVTAQVALNQPNVLFEYADPALETRSAGQKMLLRSGPENEAAIKAKLREIRTVLTAGDGPAR